MDSRLRVVGHAHQGVYALGDCAISENRPLPPLAQAAQQVGRWDGWTMSRVGWFHRWFDRLIQLLIPFPALQQAKYLAMVFNKCAEPHENLDAPSFQYKHLGACVEH